MQDSVKKCESLTESMRSFEEKFGASLKDAKENDEKQAELEDAVAKLQDHLTSVEKFASLADATGLFDTPEAQAEFASLMGWKLQDVTEIKALEEQVAELGESLEEGVKAKLEARGGMTQKERKEFITSLIQNVHTNILKESNSYPDTWNGIELRWRIADIFSEVVSGDIGKRKGKRYLDYKNFVDTSALQDVTELEEAVKAKLEASLKEKQDLRQAIEAKLEEAEQEKQALKEAVIAKLEEGK